jgi:transmembrane sensor
MAAEWVAKTYAAEPSADQQCALESWLAADIRHLGAYLKAKIVMARIERNVVALREHFMVSR